MSTIRIGKPYLTKTAQTVRLNAKISLSGFDWGGDEKVLWVEAERTYGRHFIADRADAFLLGFVHYALRYGAEIVCEAPVSERLYEQLVNQFLPWHLAAFKQTTVRKQPLPIKITAATVPELEVPGTAVGAACSCGVDSMHVFATCSDITHAVVWNMHPGAYGCTSAEREVAWESLKARCRAFAETIGKPLICLDTNYDTALFPEMWSDVQFTWANLFAIRTLQGFWGKFYLASGNPIWTLRMDISPWRCCCSYEPVLLPCLSASGPLLQLVGAGLARREKLRIIADYPPARKYLFVCRAHGQDNCTAYCEKCQETLLQMEVAGVVDRFSEVFDVERFHRRHDDFLVFYLTYVNHYTATDLVDLKPFLRWKIPLVVYLRWIASRIADRLFHHQ